MKKKTLSKSKKDTWKVFSRYIRLRDCLRTTNTLYLGRCVSCGRVVKYNECDAGHYISRSVTATLFDERNVNLQCKNCNGFPDGMTFENYRKELIKRYGDGIIIELEEKAKENKKYTIQELEELTRELKEKIKLLEDENY
jgi:hypothetical protein